MPRGRRLEPVPHPRKFTRRHSVLSWVKLAPCSRRARASARIHSDTSANLVHNETASVKGALFAIGRHQNHALLANGQKKVAKTLVCGHDIGRGVP